MIPIRSIAVSLLNLQAKYFQESLPLPLKGSADLGNSKDTAQKLRAVSATSQTESGREINFRTGVLPNYLNLLLQCRLLYRILVEGINVNCFKKSVERGAIN